ncbi:cell division protein ZapA [Thermacetogenium phaeum DSM 12270]|uniref:Cell division protein ZapA n=1 Tax=Thermacetogenium phaeum (strain ATCC BAA-254 / DSM 26808 / PB) TaxID=1089553 RepID=K4LFC2_THEPS|nr:cell division protein ZapA [Thermacetogenium phaeum]AFV11553.1 cell division protein ZapA [Thermacetogenium phaeum DSM 12270]
MSDDRAAFRHQETVASPQMNPIPKPEKNNEKSRVAVKIYGEEYVIRGNADPAFIEKIAAYVDRKMRLIGQKNPNLSLSKLAVLAALNIAEDMARLQDDYDSLVKQLEDIKKLGQ